MKPIHQVLVVAGLLGLATITWGLLTRAKPPADWLQVEAPARISPGETISIRITLSPDVDSNLLLVVDLHGTTPRQHPLRLVSRSRPQRVGAAAQKMEFRLTVPARPDIATVNAIIYLSATGDWSDHVRQVQSDSIPVKAGSSAGSELRPLPVHEAVPDPEIPRRELANLRYSITALWLLVAGGLVLRHRLSPPASANTPRPRYVPLMMACLAVAFAELLRLEPLLGDAARKLALKYDFYDERLMSQQITTLLLVIGMTVLTGLIVFRARQRRLVLGLLMHATVAASAILSLHDADALLYATPLGLPVEQLIKLAAVCLALWGLRSRVTAAPATGSA
jgi:hypothetical protein